MSAVFIYVFAGMMLGAAYYNKHKMFNVNDEVHGLDTYKILK